MTTSPSTPIDDDTLHALVDGRLPPGEAARLQARVAQDPELAARVAAWRVQREVLRQHLADVPQEPVPLALQTLALKLSRRSDAQARWSRWGGLAAGVVLAFGAGWIGHAQWSSATVVAGRAGPAEFARQAVVAHVVYAPELRHPVEVEAAQQEHLVQWLSKRLGRPLRVPQLADQGFELVGGRLLPADNGARAQFMYQSASGERITLYVGALAQPAGADAATTAFRFVREGQASSFYWVDQGFGYALSGTLPRQRLAQLAERVHRQL